MTADNIFEINLIQLKYYDTVLIFFYYMRLMPLKKYFFKNSAIKVNKKLKRLTMAVIKQPNLNMQYVA